MKTSSFDYYLPPLLIAQQPLKKRSESRLMIIDRNKKTINHHYFNDLIAYLNKGDTLVLNDSKVIPARLIGKKDITNSKIELLLLKELSNNKWECLIKPARKIKKDTIINFENDLLKAQCIERKDSKGCFIFFYEGNFYSLLKKIGQMPLPPYIHQTLKQANRYQTVYAKKLGSIAAPTAGFHFTKELLTAIKRKGVNITYLTLHVGLGTFKPVTSDSIKDHQMHAEFYSLEQSTANLLNKTKKEGGRIISVGTTVARVLETNFKKNHEFKPASGWTDIFIYPPYRFKAIDALITNFHLPKSTLIMLVSAFAGKRIIFKAYQIAISEKYRFFSFGDAMLIK